MVPTYIPLLPLHFSDHRPIFTPHHHPSRLRCRPHPLPSLDIRGSRALWRCLTRRRHCERISGSKTRSPGGAITRLLRSGERREMKMNCPKDKTDGRELEPRILLLRPQVVWGSYTNPLEKGVSLVGIPLFFRSSGNRDRQDS